MGVKKPAMPACVVRFWRAWLWRSQLPVGAARTDPCRESISLTLLHDRTVANAEQRNCHCSGFLCWLLNFVGIVFHVILPSKLPKYRPLAAHLTHPFAPELPTSLLFPLRRQRSKPKAMLYLGCLDRRHTQSEALRYETLVMEAVVARLEHLALPSIRLTVAGIGPNR